MFDCFQYNGLSAEETKEKYYRRPIPTDNCLTPIVDRSLTEKFSMQQLTVRGRAEIDLGEKYAVVIVTDGKGAITAANYHADLKKSDSFFCERKKRQAAVFGKYEPYHLPAVIVRQTRQRTRQPKLQKSKLKKRGPPQNHFCSEPRFIYFIKKAER